MTITRYMCRRLIGALMRLGRTLRGQERPRTPGTHTDTVGPIRGPQIEEQETGR